MRMGRLIVWLVGVAAAMAVIFIGGLYALQDKLIFPAPTGPLPAGDERVSLVAVETSDGERLAGLWHEPEAGEPTVVFLHGNGTAIANLLPLANAVADRGFGFLTVAWRGYPGSTGSPTEAGIFNDAEAAYDFANARTEGPIAIIGQSLGSGAAVHLANVRDAAALVLEAPYDSVLAVASARFPYLPMGALLRHPFRSDLRIANVDEPILIVHGTADTIIPIRHGRSLHERAPDGARFLEVPGATHFDINPRTLDTSLAFIREAVISNSRPNG